MKRSIAVVTLMLLAAIATDEALAQRFPGRDRGESPRDFQRRERGERPAAVPTGTEPFAALERELPSLKTDLRLTAQQVEAWSLFERSVRELAELERARRRHLISLRDRDPPPSAPKLIGMLAEDDRQKAEASADLKRYFDGLYASLDDAQQRMLDRRVVLSQSDPLGPESRR